MIGGSKTLSKMVDLNEIIFCTTFPGETRTKSPTHMPALRLHSNTCVSLEFGGVKERKGGGTDLRTRRLSFRELNGFDGF